MFVYVRVSWWSKPMCCIMICQHNHHSLLLRWGQRHMDGPESIGYLLWHKRSIWIHIHDLYHTFFFTVLYTWVWNTWHGHLESRYQKMMCHFKSLLPDAFCRPGGTPWRFKRLRSRQRNLWPSPYAWTFDQFGVDPRVQDDNMIWFNHI